MTLRRAYLQRKTQSGLQYRTGSPAVARVAVAVHLGGDHPRPAAIRLRGHPNQACPPVSSDLLLLRRPCAVRFATSLRTEGLVAGLEQSYLPPQLCQAARSTCEAGSLWSWTGFGCLRCWSALSSDMRLKV